MARQVLRRVPDHVRLLVIDWPALRRGLWSLRAGSPYAKSQSSFSRATGLSRITIARLEDVESDPIYQPDLITIARWLSAVGWTRGCGRFIAEFETPPEGARLSELDRQQLRKMAESLLRAIDLM